MLLSQLAHVELISPRPEETARWMTDVLGLEETTREGQSVYLRGWAEWLLSSLVVTEGREPAVGHIAWRAYGPGDLEVVAQRLDDEDVAIGWLDESVGHGPAFRYRAPSGGHLHEVFWDVERYQAPPEKAEPDFQNRPQRFTARGAEARYVDHVTIATPEIEADADFYRALGYRQTARISPEPGFTVFSTMTCNGVRSTHDLGLVPEMGGARGRVNHIAYRVDQRLDVERAAEVLIASGTPIEFGPGIHGCDEITYVYAREPGGFRIEVNSGGWVNQEPDFATTTWRPEQGGTTLWKNVAMPESMMDSFPSAPADAGRMRRTGLFAES